jgi:ABC-type nickel/cobalt efflux system permease component RcnA
MRNNWVVLLLILVAVLLTIIPLLYLGGRLSMDQTHQWLLGATLLWFLLALWKYWRERNRKPASIKEESMP